MADIHESAGRYSVRTSQMPYCSSMLCNLTILSMSPVSCTSQQGILLNKHGSNETCLIKEIGAGMHAY